MNQTLAGLRDRAILGVMFYSFARVRAVAGMNAEDYFQQGKRAWFRFHEKGGKTHDVPTHHKAIEYMDLYIVAAGIGNQKSAPIFRTLHRGGGLTSKRMDRRDVYAMVRRRAAKRGSAPESVVIRFGQAVLPFICRLVANWNTRK